MDRGLELVRAVDGFIDRTKPFQLAKQPGNEARIADILYQCAETFRLASLRLWPVLPAKMEDVWRRLGLSDYSAALADRGAGRLGAWSAWGGLHTGAEVASGPALFPRREIPVAEGPGRG